MQSAGAVVADAAAGWVIGKGLDGICGQLTSSRGGGDKLALKTNFQKFELLKDTPYVKQAYMHCINNGLNKGN